MKRIANVVVATLAPAVIAVAAALFTAGNAPAQSAEPLRGDFVFETLAKPQQGA